MSDLTFWQPTIGAMEIIIGCLPRETQRRIVEQLQLLAKDQEAYGLMEASYFSRALSGELAPSSKPKLPPTPKPKLVIVR